ncbi:uncharacterized protein LOC143739671 [Siphateles boraxobius]|uniref:uncharacterized protein LOC143739671 n=1 Tax=Siphateles boraxobius TaxID=180520 RepID=UPI0040646A0E
MYTKSSRLIMEDQILPQGGAPDLNHSEEKAHLSLSFHSIMLLCALVICSVLAGNPLGDVITSHDPEKEAHDAEANESPIRPDSASVASKEGSNETLSCTFEESAYRLHWY